MIQKITIGKQEDILHLEFGNGDIHLAGTELDGKPGLVFRKALITPIGDASDIYKDAKTTDDFPEIKLCMTFDKPESISVLIHSLIEVQEEIFGMKKKKE